MNPEQLIRDAVLRVGEVSAVEGRKIFVKVDRNKNLSDMFLDGEILRNIAVNSFVEIRKGFLSIIGRVEGEKIQSDRSDSDQVGQPLNSNNRLLTIALAGYIDERGVFTGGTKELPLIGNEAFLLSPTKIALIHRLAVNGAPSVDCASLFGDDIRIPFPIDGLFNSHIAIFGNTGSGKTNTLAALYSELVKVLSRRNPEKFTGNARFVLFDFNGEYISDACITDWKVVYSLSTHGTGGNRLPMPPSTLLDVEVLSILADATEKTQKPFIKRAMRLMKQVDASSDADSYMRAVLRAKVTDTLQMADKNRAFLILDYLGEVLPAVNGAGVEVDLQSDLEWHNQANEFKHRTNGAWYRQSPSRIAESILYQHVELFHYGTNLVDNLILALYVQLISDVLTNRAQNDHIAPLINRLKGKREDIDKLFDFGASTNFWQRNFVVINLHDVSLEMKKTIPLLLAKRLYSEQKSSGAGKTLTMIVDEAHNILSRESARESETWKDYRLETFEEIIKEGRKFGVFVTLSSQRPSDISPTIASQCHNYFIHRLVNQLDLKMISTAVSYIDRVTEESIPTLPTGTCIFSGVIAPMPLKINVQQVSESARPQSSTRSLLQIVPEIPAPNG